MNDIRVQLPTGSILLARDRNDPHNPGIEIRVIEPDDESDGHGDLVAIVEHNEDGIYMRCYQSNDDEPIFSEAYSIEGANHASEC